MKFYIVSFEKNGETITSFAVHAASEAEAHRKVGAFFDAHPHFDISGRSKLTVRVEEAHVPKAP